jgi:hypothetical protein
MVLPSRRTIFILLLAGLLLAEPGFAQDKERCALAGTVVNSATNDPIPRALVSYFGGEMGYRFTDVGGNFRVDNVSCKQYRLSVTKPGFVSPEEPDARVGRLRALTAEMPAAPANVSVTLKPDSPPTRIALLPVSSIAGAVLDENGEPLAGVAVQLTEVKPSPSGGVDYLPGTSAHTDDRGHYEFLDLRPGDYVVRLAGEVSSTRYFQGNTLNPNNDHRGMQPVYYPDVDSVSSATVLHPPPGQRATADFRHPTELAFDVNGRLTNFVAQAHTTLQMYRDGDKLPLGSAYVNLTTGQFRLVDVPPGTYTLRAQQYQGDPPKWLAAEAPVTIRGEAISDLELSLSSGVNIPVSVSYEAGAPAGMPVQISLQPQHSREGQRFVTVGKLSMLREGGPPEPGAPPEEAPAEQPSPSALSDVVPDKYKLTAQALGPGGYVAAATLGDMDVLHGEFSIGGGGGELHVVVRGDCATVEGKVTFKGEPAVGAQVFLKPSTVGGEPLFGLTDQDGHFQIPGIAPGDYKIQAWAGMPEPKAMLSDAGESVTLQASEHRTVALEALPGDTSLGGQQ